MVPVISPMAPVILALVPPVGKVKVGLTRGQWVRSTQQMGSRAARTPQRTDASWSRAIKV